LRPNAAIENKFVCFKSVCTELLKVDRSRFQTVLPTVLPHSTFGGHVMSSVTDHLIPHIPFPIGGPLEPSIYL